MSRASGPRQPQLFSTDDPKLNAQPLPTELSLQQPTATVPAGNEDGVLRPTLADLGGRGWPWGGLFLAAVAGAASLAATAWLLRLLAAAMARDDWLGWTTLGLLLIAAFAFLMLLMRELVGFTRSPQPAAP
jgi:putative membrane protein